MNNGAPDLVDVVLVKSAGLALSKDGSEDQKLSSILKGPTSVAPAVDVVLVNFVGQQQQQPPPPTSGPTAVSTAGSAGMVDVLLVGTAANQGSKRPCQDEVADSRPAAKRPATGSVKIVIDLTSEDDNASDANFAGNQSSKMVIEILDSDDENNAAAAAPETRRRASIKNEDESSAQAGPSSAGAGPSSAQAGRRGPAAPETRIVPRKAPARQQPAVSPDFHTINELSNCLKQLGTQDATAHAET